MPRVLILYNQPTLPEEHPDYESEHSIVEIADKVADVLGSCGHAVELLGLGHDPCLLWTELDRLGPDVVFNLYEGTAADSETECWVTGLLQWKGIPYIGTPANGLTLARDKPVAKWLLQGAGIPSAAFEVVERLPAPVCRLPFPVFVKPAYQDASVGISQDSVCQDEESYRRRVEHVFATYGGPVLVEEYIAGREFNVGLVEMPELRYLPPAEVIFPEDRPGRWGILTYDGKWKPGTADYETTPPKYPADIPAELAQRMGELAMAAFRLFHCRDYARIDFRLRDGIPYLLEINPNPEICDYACFGLCLGSADIPYDRFLVQMIDNALARRATKAPVPCSV